MRKIVIIAWKDTYLRFTDRAQLMIMILAPILLSTIIGLAFGGASGGAITFEDIPLAIVNLDEGGSSGGMEQNYGDIFTGIFVPTEGTANDLAETSECGVTDTGGNGQTLEELFTVSLLTDVEAARRGVEDGTYTAAILIPSDFTTGLSPILGVGVREIRGTEIEVYANDSRPIGASIVRSVASSISEQFVTGNVTIAVTVSEMIERAQEDFNVAMPLIYSQVSGDFNLNVNCAFVPTQGTISFVSHAVNQAEGLSGFVFMLVLIGSAQAIFSALFTAEFGILSIYDERINGTYQRLIVSPTARYEILLGKVLGVFLSVLLQLVLLMTALNLVAFAVEGPSVGFIWGNNILLLILLVLALVLAVSGVGILLAGVARTAEQARTIGPMLNITLGALGGAFGFILPASVSQFSIIYWARDAFLKLANGDTAISVNLLVLVVLGLLMTVVGLWLFNRRSEA